VSADFLLELLSEEIPARMQARARNDLARLFAEALAAAGLSHEGITTYSTPRRLALIARGLPSATEAVSEELKGPRTSARPQALEGFLRKTGLTQEQLQDRDGTWFAVIDKPGRATSEVLAEAVAAIVRDFPWPKSMRWGAASQSTSSLRWVRPLHSIVALLGEEIVPVVIDGIECGATTRGHRFHHPGPITIGGAHDYVEKLRACHVIVDQEEREATIRQGAIDATEDAGFLLVEDEGLVVENAGLTSLPVPLFGSFDHHFLDVPEEVIQLTARINQKYFVMRDAAGKLAPHFVCVANIAANDGGEAIVAGNERVLAARLADARFFWEHDLKVPLEEQAKKLSGVVFHEKLGTVADKVERVAKLARWLVEQQIVTPAKAGVSGSKEMPASAAMTVEELADQVERAARLAKADLVTGMVGEFPELQGVIGGHLARAQGEPDAIADAIRDHYKPVGQGDEVPTAPVTTAVALADKLDSLRSFFAINERPTGSKDPFALRRAALGVIQLILSNRLRINLGQLISEEVVLSVVMRGVLSAEGRTPDERIANYAADPARKVAVEANVAALYSLLDFFADRLKVQQRDAGVRHDLIDAVFALGGEDDLVRLLARVEALQQFVETPEGADLLTGYKRAANILKKEKWDLPRVMAGRGEQGIPQTGDEDPLVLVEEPAIAEAVREMALGAALPADAPAEEVALINALVEAEPKAAAAVQAEDFTGAMAALAILRAPIDAFFDKVTVNDPDGSVRARRLNLLARFRDAVHQVADFSKIEG
jgi:glycyl-tRNA synthetase beta chain